MNGTRQRICCHRNGGYICMMGIHVEDSVVVASNESDFLNRR
jgi:hypothetical protein